ncbi:MAG: choice-of-anchor V domain-containing protein [Woeseia sp.]
MTLIARKALCFLCTSVAQLGSLSPFLAAQLGSLSPFLASPFLASLLLAASQTGHCYENGAPPAHTGGFGEPDCSLCHSDSDKNPPDGMLKIDGLPGRYSPGVVYDFEVVLRHPELKSGGFQLAIRSAGGEPAGEVISPSGRTRIVADAGQRYLQHSNEGREPEKDGFIRWRVRWIAPLDGMPQSTVYLHVAANAANDDISALGDYIFTLERELREDTQ